MGFDSIWHWLILLLVVLVIFGTGKLTRIGPDLGKAVREFKKAMRGDEDKNKESSSEQDSERLKADPPLASGPARDAREHAAGKQDDR